MIRLRPAEERGETRLDWLDSRHTFSFGEYHDPRQMGFRNLRVINEDIVRPGRGFGTHSHQDMEIVTYVLEGALEHKDSLGTGSIIRPGEVQRMSAGRGVSHSEFNPSPSAPVHFLQIWIQPALRGIPPSYEQRAFAAEELRGRLRLVGARDARGGAVTIHQDVSLYATRVARGDRVVHALRPGRHAWVQVTRGALAMNGVTMAAGDGAALSDLPEVDLRAGDDGGDALLFDLA